MKKPLPQGGEAVQDSLPTAAMASYSSVEQHSRWRPGGACDVKTEQRGDSTAFRWRGHVPEAVRDTITVRAKMCAAWAARAGAFAAHPAPAACASGTDAGVAQGPTLSISPRAAMSYSFRRRRERAGKDLRAPDV